MIIKKIVLTGGPCAGKTTGMSYIQNFFTERGYHVIFVPEIATEIINAGVKKSTSLETFERCIFEHQLAKEASYDQMVSMFPDGKVLLVYDRGLMDSKAFSPPEIFNECLNDHHITEIEAKERYDAIFHMVTAAKGAEAFYTLENNAARSETPEEAIAADERLVNCWNGHPFMKIIDNSTDFEGKMERLLTEISAFLNEKGPYSTERKYLIEMPDADYLESLNNCNKTEIEQIYLNSKENETVRIRKRGIDGNYVYTLTKKRFNGKTQRLTLEQRLNKEMYDALKMNADETKKPIHKTRYSLIANEQNFDIDIFPFLKKEAIMEIKLSNKNIEVKIPDFIKVIKEVTDDEEYQNYTLATK